MLDNFRQTAKIVIRSPLGNKTRSFLTMLGIIIGVSAVVLIVSLGAGAQYLILSQVDSFGSDLIAITPGQSDEKGPPAFVFGIKVTSLKEADTLAIKKKHNAPHVIAAVSFYDTNVSAYNRDLSYDAKLEGISGDYLEVEKAEIELGRFFSNEEINSSSGLVVLGSNVAEELFPGYNPVGQNIRIKNRNLLVIGVFKFRGQAGFSSPDDSIFAPLKFVQKEIAGVNYLNAIKVKVDDEKNINETMEMIKMTLREQHGIDNPEDDDFTVQSFRDALDAINAITNALKYFLAAMAALSLLVGGIGIMNIMLVSVKERTKEIGLRKALGATGRQVRFQFLLEAVFLTLIGGIIGLIGGAFISFFVSLVIKYLGYEWDFVISFFSIILALGISTLIGIIFGYYPAKQAAKLDPIEALRYE